MRFLNYLPGLRGRGHLHIRFCAVVAFLLVTCAGFATPPIEIWKSRQLGRFGDYYFPVSVGKPSKPTPTGRYTVKKKVVDYWSRKYDRAMPYSVFFTDAHAIHSGDISTRSRGCIRVERPTAQWLYHYARTGKTKVIIYP